jgi:4-diphosphocytidyl-2-C-methyl-D-erythritol kinase
MQCEHSSRAGWGQAFFAPAKLNLFLHVTGRRADGYHLLQTVFRFVDHGDWLRFSPRADGEIRRGQDISGVPEDTDLCLRAAKLLREAAGSQCAGFGVTITLDKRLPMGGGLGGGSSDAATVLLALNVLWGIHFPREKLQALGLQLGADVPVFVFGRAAFAEGVGEQLAPIDLPPAWYLVAEPAAHVATAKIFASSRLTRDTKIITMPDFSAGLPLQKPGLRNDLQAAVCELKPQVEKALAVLSELGPARMSGSGACVFAEFADEALALQALAALQERAPALRAWVAKGLDIHPLHALCALQK